MTREGTQESTPPQGGGVDLSGVAMAGLVAVVAAILLLLWVSLAFGAGLISDQIVRDQDGPAELLLIPLAVLAGALLRPRLSRFTTLQGSNWRPILPLMVGCALVALFAYLGWTWERPAGLLSVERVLGTLLTVAAAFAAAALYPRLMAALAGAIAAPALFGLVAFLVPDSLIRTIGADVFESSTGRNLGPSGDDWYSTELGQTLWGTALYQLMRWVGYWGPVTLLGTWFLLRRHAFSHACWTGAIALFLATGQFYLQMVGEGFGR